jgi:probable HAF family extracellular repeat protein
MKLRQKHQFAQFVGFSLAALAAHSAQAANYTFSDLGTINGPYAGTGAVASQINNLGQVSGYDNTSALIWNGNTTTRLENLQDRPGVGSAINDSGHVAGFVDLGAAADATIPVRWNGTTATPLQALSGGTQGYANYANGINNNDQVVGTSWDGASIRPVRWDGTTVTDIGTLGGIGGEAYAINDAGAIVGISNTLNDEAQHATYWNGSTITDLGTLGGTSYAYGINEVGQITGYSYLDVDNTTYSAVKWLSSSNAPIDLGSLPGVVSDLAVIINTVGQIVGYSEIGDVIHATLWDGDQVIDLNDFLPAELAAAGWHLDFASGINDYGVIVGYASQGLDPDTAITAAYMLTPTAVPVPGAVWLFGSIVTGFMGWSRRKM